MYRVWSNYLDVIRLPSTNNGNIEILLPTIKDVSVQLKGWTGFSLKKVTEQQLCFAIKDHLLTQSATRPNDLAVFIAPFIRQLEQQLDARKTERCRTQAANCSCLTLTLCRLSRFHLHRFAKVSLSCIFTRWPIRITEHIRSIRS